MKDIEKLHMEIAFVGLQYEDFRYNSIWKILHTNPKQVCDFCTCKKFFLHKLAHLNNFQMLSDLYSCSLHPMCLSKLNEKHKNINQKIEI